MIHPQDGNASNRPTVYPEISITTFCRSKEEAASFANEALSLFVPADILPSITITERDVSEGSSAIRVTIDYLDT